MFIKNVLSSLVKDLCTKPVLSDIISSIPKGTFSFKEYRQSLHKSTGALDYLDYVTQLPYLKLVTAPPIFVFFFIVTLLVAVGMDLYLIFE